MATISWYFLALVLIIQSTVINEMDEPIMRKAYIHAVNSPKNDKAKGMNGASPQAIKAMDNG